MDDFDIRKWRAGAWEVAFVLVLVLPCGTLLDRPSERTYDYVIEHEQFDQPGSAFRAVQFQLADAFVALQGLDEIAKNSPLFTRARPDDSLADAIFRTTHQLQGVIGVL